MEEQTHSASAGAEQNHSSSLPASTAAPATPLRRPAWNNAAEQSVLGAILLDSTIFDQVADILQPNDFYAGAHRVIFQAITQLLDNGEPADPVTLQQFLHKQEELQSVGGSGYLAQLIDTVPSTANAAAYARLVRDKSLLRELAKQATSIIESVYQGKAQPLDKLLDEAEQRIFSVGEGRTLRSANYYPLKAVLMPVLHSIEQQMKHKGTVTGVPTGFVDLDRMLSGLQNSDLLILAGRPSMGKTSFAMNIAANAAVDHQVPVAVFSLEMSKEQLVSRMLSSAARIDAQKLRTGWLDERDYGQLISMATRLSDAPLYIDDTPAISISALRARARRMRREQKIQLILIDYLQLMQGELKTENRVQEISQISRGLKALAKELHIPVIALSQLSRKLEDRPNKRPILSDLRESGAIEQDADVVLFVFREEVYKENDPALTGLAEIIVAKQRNGPTGKVKLTFQKQFTRFDNHADSRFGS
ncbi:replicative DNA helicase [Candidatus Magnetaquicoccus inordinatus]|uniref:replicative DNA helicase n=1 Tax=Candidatus Magnetaquicoccus inordinatus TaxID=2496818 RepID=UPI00102D09DE|nr:replicative DNA helicase [Candidatus Magnetaquicoccus inordinatus]